MRSKKDVYMLHRPFLYAGESVPRRKIGTGRGGVKGDDGGVGQDKGRSGGRGEKIGKGRENRCAAGDITCQHIDYLAMCC